MNIGVILLAAGSSSRLGHSKQLLKFEGVPLLHHAAKLALESGIGPVVVVLGANEEAHRKAIAALDVECIPNPGWEAGMGSSLKTGLNHFLKVNPDLDAIVAMVCDQPLLTSDHLRKLVETGERTGKPAIASLYSDTNGVPALFHRVLFPEIMAMPDDQGARQIFKRHLDDIASVDFPDGATDIDTPEDRDRLIA